MTGPEHYREAERLNNIYATQTTTDEEATLLARWAQVHATLALAAAQAGQTLGLHGVPSREWSEASQ